ncbi:MAG TPA: hypothetical protein DDZ81_10395 [Acetobacteraceae bacterium]|jgi:hypothetical protein|nr:hypothetical protein [Acetobacteraceae bacterium]
MPPPPTRLDPEGLYARLGIEPVATRASVVSAFRAKARLLHPDVPVTGNAQAFVAVKQAYDVLSNRDRREAYDRKARAMAERPALEPEVAAAVRRPVYHPPPPPSPAPSRAPMWRSRISGVSVGVWAGLGAFLCLCLYEAGSHLMTPLPANSAGIRPNAQSVEPLSPAAHRAVLYGPAPVRLAGTPNFYVVPAGTPAVLWRLDPERNALVPLGQLPPFSAVQAVRIVRQNGMLEVLVNEKGNGFIGADHLTPGDATAARNAYCGYNSGPTPADAEVLERRGYGNGRLRIENRAVQPAVMKLRDETGAVVVAVFLGPGGHADLDGLPEGIYRPEFAIGELWSRACNAFAAGMRARRMQASIRVPGSARIVVTADTEGASEISDQAFEME